MSASLSAVVPGLSMPAPSDTAIPGLARRRVWAAPDVTSHSLLLVMFGLALATAFGSLGLNGLADIYGGSDWVTAGVLPGWRAACVAGGAAVAAAHVWLYRRLTQPSERLELVRS